MYDSELQAKLDNLKWLESERNGKDMCGTYAYCVECDKSVSCPCACAYKRFESAKTEQNSKQSQSDTSLNGVEGLSSSLGKRFDFDKVMAKKASRKSLTFAEKYALADDIVKERYAKLKDALTATEPDAPKIKSRISKQCDTYRREGDIVAKVTIIGSSLRVNLPLDPDAPEYNDGKTPHVDAGRKKVYEQVPFQFKVNSKLALKRALILIEAVK